MATRPIVSYDDITLPYDQPESVPNNPASSSQNARAPPSKKRKKNNNNHNNQKAKRREDSGASKKSNSQTAEFQKHLSSSNGISKNPSPQETYEAEGDAEGEAGEYGYEYEYEVEEESRELTHEEIWDDSALVEAWEAAMEEYEAYHGSEKDWKKEPVKKSPLWYNVPVDPSKLTKPAEPPAVSIPLVASANGDEHDSKPLDFNTFVPSHDPSLDLPPVLEPTTGSHALPSATTHKTDSSSGFMVSQDEAFQRALNAMYWGGYWTAMYHSQRQRSQPHPQHVATAQSPPAVAEEEEIVKLEDLEEDFEDEEIEIDEQEDEFISTQR